jgi:DNA-binding transcriptional LysR family regulator
MQLETLRTFCDVVRLRSFSRGAQANGLSQSRASQSVHELEEHLGTVLIERGKRPLRLTPEGELFYVGCREVVDRYSELEARVRRIQTEANAVVRVAAIYSVGLGDMNEHIKRFTLARPQAEVRMEYLHPDRVYERVENGEADFGIVSFPKARRDLAVVAWRREQMVAVCAPSHRLAREQTVSPSALNGEKFVGFDRGLTIRREVDRFLRRHGVRVEVALEFDNVEAIKRAVEVGSGISILPAPTLEREAQSGSLVKLLLDAEEFVRPMGIIYRRGRRLYPNAQRFIELLCGGSNGERGGNPS